MSGGVKAGLIFGALQVLLVALFTLLGFVPAAVAPGVGAAGLLGAVCCGPLGTLLVGAVAGYIGVRWNREPAGIGQGVLAGGITGGGALLGSLLVWGGVLLMANAVGQQDPEAMGAIMRQALEQQPSTGLTEADMPGVMAFSVLLVGLCSGLVALLFALASGALGGWLAVRGRRAAPPPPIAMPPAEG